MTFTVNFEQAEIKTNFDWQLAQEVNVVNDHGEVIAKAELELVTLNKHRDAKASLKQLSEQGDTDWQLPFLLYFNKQNISADLAEQLAVSASGKSQQHIMLEAISVLPDYRQQGIGKQLLAAIANKYPKVQSVNVLAMPMSLFIDSEQCESEPERAYYQALALNSDSTSHDSLKQFFTQTGFVEIALDQSQLAEPLPFELFIASPKSINDKTISQ